MAELLAHQRGEAVRAFAKIDRPRCYHDLYARRGRDHVAALTARSTSRSQAGSTPATARTTAPPDLDADRRRAPHRRFRARPSATRLRHHRNEEWRLVGRQAERAGTRCLAPCEQMLGRDVVPARHLGHHRPRRVDSPRSVPWPCRSTAADVPHRPGYPPGHAAPKRQLYAQPYMRTVLYVTARLSRSARPRQGGGGQNTAYPQSPTAQRSRFRSPTV